MDKNTKKNKNKKSRKKKKQKNKEVKKMMTLWYPTAKQHVSASKVSIASLEVCYVH